VLKNLARLLPPTRRGVLSRDWLPIDHDHIRLHIFTLLHLFRAAWRMPLLAG
jgi:hypothetical protein